MAKSSTTENEVDVSATILVVEDDEGLCHLVKKNLQRAGFQTVSASSGAEAIKTMGKDSDVFLLLDYRLQDMTAKQVIESLIETQHQVPFIVMTGQGDERIAVEMMKLGALDYIVKDSSFMDSLPKVINRAVRQVDTEKKLKEAEARLRESQRSLSTLMTNLPGMVYRCQDDANRTMTFVSDGCMELTGYESTALVQNSKTSYMQLLHTDDRDMVSNDIRSALSDKRPFDLVYRIHTAGDEEKWLWEKGSGVFSPDGELEALEGFITDITEVKKAEEEKQRMEQQLQLTGRLAAVGELAAGVAHELNNPLAAVQAYAQFLSAKKDLDETTKTDIETIYKEAQRASRITGNLLSFARKHKPEKSSVSINKVVEDSLELHSYRLRVNNIEIVTKLEPKLPRTMADFHQMQQAFTNIIINAEQAIAEANGKGKLLVETHRAGNMIQVVFSDDGPGISEDSVNRIFDPFYTTKAVGKGTGLGLSICYGIVQEHGGRIHAKSNPGAGTTFVLEIPVVSKGHSTADQDDRANKTDPTEKQLT